MAYIYGIYLKQHISAKKLDIRYHIYMVTRIWDIYGIYPKQLTYVCKEIENRTKIKLNENEKKLTSRRVPQF